MTYCATVSLPMPPDRGNSRRHWAVQRRVEAEWKVRATVDLANSRLRPPNPLQRFTLHVIAYSKRKSDIDNLTSRCKVPIDLLRSLGWVANDGPDHLVSLTVVPAVDTKRPRLEIHLCEEP